MVRILSCHHFRGQRIGRCDEAMGVAVAGEAVIVALDHQVNIYGRVDPKTTCWISEASSPGQGIGLHHGFSPSYDDNRIYDLGTNFSYQSSNSKQEEHPSRGQSGRPRTTSGSSSVDSVESDTELRLSHSFSTIDLIDTISYNDAGKYILCLEKRETLTNSSTTSVRVYFNWEKNHHSKPMKARIAGLVSPTGAEPEEDSLMMVEIPLTSPATAVTSCNLSGHLATLSAESILNIFLFRAKEATGRVKVHYFDFDRVYSLEMPGFVPNKLCFLTDFVACMNSQEIHVFRVKKEDFAYASENHGPGSLDSFVKSKPPAITSFFIDHKLSTIGKGTSSKTQSPISKGNLDKVVFDPKNETVKVHLNSIVRANRKRRCPSSLISEEFHDEIVSNKTKVVFSAIHPGISVEDIIRVYVNTAGGTNSTSANNPRFLQVGMYPVRVKDNLGGIALLIATPKEGFLYHLPLKRGLTASRVTTYPLTAPLLSFTFDSLFFHALTETGLETYTFRGLYYAIRDTEGFQTFKTDCPFQEEAPCLVGIRPFLRINHMACNNQSLCLLACSHQSTSSNKKAIVTSVSPNNEENLCTIYTLELPDIDLIYEDIIRSANIQIDSNKEAYFTLLCEAHTLLRLYINAHPASESAFIAKLRETCKLIGLEYLKSSCIKTLPMSEALGTTSAVQASTLNQSPTNLPSNFSSPLQSDVEFSSLNISEDLMNKGVTYLIMGRCDLQEVFSQVNSSWVKDPRLIPGIVRLIEVTLSDHQNGENTDNNKISPTLATLLVDFLASNGSNVLIDLVIHAPFFRESNSRRLMHVLTHLAESQEYQPKVTLALVLTLVAVGGVDQPTRNQVNKFLHKTKIHDLEFIVPREAVFETRGKQVNLTDLAICFAESDSPQLLVNMVVNSLKRNEITLSDIMLTFAQAVNLNSDAHLQHCITKCLTSILEIYLSRRLISEIQDNNQPGVISSPVTHTAGVASDIHLNFTDEEKRAVQTLVRTYLSNFSLALTNVSAHGQNNTSSVKSSSPQKTSENISLKSHGQAIAPVPNSNVLKSNNAEVPTKQNENNTLKEVAKESTIAERRASVSVDILKRNQFFGNIPSFVNYVLSLNSTGGTIAPQSQSLATSSLFPNEETRESFIKLLSLLSSALANFGVKDLILTYLYKNTSQKPTLDTALYLILQVIAETTENSVNILLAKQPTTVILYAKEMFGRKTYSWKTLVSHLKKSIQSRPDSGESDMFATILENVYLHLANTLTLTELEQVLDKETEESSKFHSICKRVELANTYASMVIRVSTEYLNHK